MTEPTIIVPGNTLPAYSILFKSRLAAFFRDSDNADRALYKNCDGAESIYLLSVENDPKDPKKNIYQVVAVFPDGTEKFSAIQVETKGVFLSITGTKTSEEKKLSLDAQKTLLHIRENTQKSEHTPMRPPSQ